MYSLGCWSHLPTQTPLQGSSWLWNLAQEMRINEPINCSIPGAAPGVTQDGKATLVLPCSGSSSCGSNADPDVMPLPSKCKSFIHAAVAEMIPERPSLELPWEDGVVADTNIPGMRRESAGTVATLPWGIFFLWISLMNKSFGRVGGWARQGMNRD